MNGRQITLDENLARDLQEARRIQMGMLPQEIPELPGFEISAHSSPAIAVGGDFYDFIPLGQERVGVVIGDAVGHGIAAALLMTMALTDFRSIAPRESAAGTVLNSVNRRLAQGMRSRAYVASSYAVLDRANHRLTCAMGGLQPLLVKAKLGECVPIEPSGTRFPLGASSKSVYGNWEVDMEIGDALVLFTDGIPEAMNETHEPYSFERFERTLVANRWAGAKGILDAVLADVEQFTGGHPQEDDITMVTLKATESFAAAPTVRPRQLIAGEQKLVTALFAVADEELSDAVMNQIRATIREYGGIVDAMDEEMLVGVFGVPIAHGDDAERAVAAAQAIQALELSRSAESPLQFCVGVNTGTAIVRRGNTLDYRELGETLYHALYLANAAEPDQILVGEKTHALTHGAFEFGPGMASLDGQASFFLPLP